MRFGLLFYGHLLGCSSQGGSFGRLVAVDTLIPEAGTSWSEYISESPRETRVYVFVDKFVDMRMVDLVSDLSFEFYWERTPWVRVIPSDVNLVIEAVVETKLMFGYLNGPEVESVASVYAAVSGKQRTMPLEMMFMVDGAALSAAAEAAGRSDFFDAVAPDLSIEFVQLQDPPGPGGDDPDYAYDDPPFQNRVVVTGGVRETSDWHTLLVGDWRTEEKIWQDQPAPEWDSYP